MPDILFTDKKFDDFLKKELEGTTFSAIYLTECIAKLAKNSEGFNTWVETMEDEGANVPESLVLGFYLGSKFALTGLNGSDRI